MTPATSIAVTLNLPWPPDELSPNARPDPRAKWQATSNYRSACWVAALAVRRRLEHEGVSFPLRPPVVQVVTFVLDRMTRRDFQNLYASIKALEDGVVDAGVLPDDSIKVIDHVELRCVVGDRKSVLVRLEGAS